MTTTEDGSQASTKSALGKVYNHAIGLQIGPTSSQGPNHKIIFETYESACNNPNYKEGTLIVSMWDLLASLYEIRNETAHAGEFNIATVNKSRLRTKKAIELSELEHGIFFSQTRSIVETMINKEIGLFDGENVTT